MNWLMFWACLGVSLSVTYFIAQPRKIQHKAAVWSYYVMASALAAWLAPPTDWLRYTAIFILPVFWNLLYWFVIGRELQEMGRRYSNGTATSQEWRRSLVATGMGEDGISASREAGVGDAREPAA